MLVRVLEITFCSKHKEEVQKFSFMSRCFESYRLIPKKQPTDANSTFNCWVENFPMPNSLSSRNLWSGSINDSSAFGYWLYDANERERTKQARKFCNFVLSKPCIAHFSHPWAESIMPLGLSGSACDLFNFLMFNQEGVIRMGENCAFCRFMSIVGTWLVCRCSKNC